MFKAKNETDQWVAAKDAINGHRYYCPVCRDRLKLVFGSKSFLDHFRHRADSACTYGANETPEHAEKKLGIASALEAVVGVNNVRVEYRLPDGQRADVYFETQNQGVAVEVQRSAIAERDLHERIESYSDKKIASLWLTSDLKRYLNSVPTGDISPTGSLPSYVWRIAGLTDEVAFDWFSDPALRATSVVGVKLKLQKRYKYIPGRPDPILELFWPTDACSLPVGSVRKDIGATGHNRWLWIPRSESGQGQVSTRARRELRRREEITTAGLVDCNRPIVESAFANQTVVLQSVGDQPAELSALATERGVVQAGFGLEVVGYSDSRLAFESRRRFLINNGFG